MARLYANENFPLPVVEELRKLGDDVLTTYESGQAGAALPDAEVLAFALAEGRALLTLNRRHFIRLHGTTPDHAGIIVCTFDPDFVALAHRIHAALEAHPAISGQLVRINRRLTSRSTGRRKSAAPVNSRPLDRRSPSDPLAACSLSAGIVSSL